MAINVSGGKILWYKKFDSINIAAATMVNDLVFTATCDGSIYALNRPTGERSGNTWRRRNQWLASRMNSD